MNRNDLENITNEREALDAENGKVAEVLNSLPRVEAPANFEFGVKARIAAGAARPRATLVPFLKLVAPLSLVLLVAAFVIFYGALPADQNTPPVAEVVPVEEIREPAPLQDPGMQASGPQVVDQIGDEFATASTRSNDSGRVKRTDRSASNATRREGSVDMGLKDETKNVILPPGFESNVRRNQNSNSPRGVDVPVREILEMLGIKAEFANGGWTVRSTVENSTAHRSGVHTNDVIEAIDGQSLAEATKLTDGFQGKSLRVRRDGKQIRLDLRN